RTRSLLHQLWLLSFTRALPAFSRTTFARVHAARPLASSAILLWHKVDGQSQDGLHMGEHSVWIIGLYIHERRWQALYVVFYLTCPRTCVRFHYHRAIVLSDL
ncbi:uncharacterized protein LAESUDRAFT_729510, partial [Laetiporus sulphureus 93-53]